MPDQQQVGQTFITDLIFIAFLERLNCNETTISLEQLHTRGFTPHPQLTRDCVCHLIRNGRVGGTIVERVGRSKRNKRDLKLSISKEMGDIDRFIALRYVRLYQSKDDNAVKDQLEELDQVLKQYECIEYCRYYLDKEGLTLKENQCEHHKLSLLTKELEQEQVFMVGWRAVKNAALSASTRKRRSVTLSEICNLSYKYFLDYRKRNIQIDHYRAPYHLLNSSLRNTLVIYTRSGEKLEQEKKAILNGN